MNAAFRQIHAFVAWAFVASIGIQVFLAGAAIPQLGGRGDFGAHVDFGYTMGIIALVLVLAAAGGRLPRRDIGFAVGLLVLYVVQTLLPLARGSTPVVAALHPVTALLLFGLAAMHAIRAWRQRGG